MAQSHFSESELEKFISDFVYDKVRECVRLHLSDTISIRPIRTPLKGGARLLAAFWCNILQHNSNFPPATHVYVANTVDRSNGKLHDILELNIDKDGMQFFVDMSNGSLTIGGQYVYDWFTSHFKNLLVHFDPIFARNWIFVPTPKGHSQSCYDNQSQRDELKTETEAYLLLEGRGKWNVGSDLTLRLTYDRLSIAGRDPSACGMWSGQEVELQLQDLNKCSGLFDCHHYVYALWRSTLNHWLSCIEGGSVYIATPLLDEQRLAVITEISLQNRYTKTNIAAIYTSVRCDPYRPGSESSCGTIQTNTMERYSVAEQTFLEHAVLQRIAYCAKISLGSSFTARLTKDGFAEVLSTGASYHERDLQTGRLASVTFQRISSDLFHDRYLKRLEETSVTPANFEACVS